MTKRQTIRINRLRTTERSIPLANYDKRIASDIWSNPTTERFRRRNDFDKGTTSFYLWSPLLLTSHSIFQANEAAFSAKILKSTTILKVKVSSYSAWIKHCTRKIMLTWLNRINDFMNFSTGVRFKLGDGIFPLKTHEILRTRKN